MPETSATSGQGIGRMHPMMAQERYSSLDVIRGVALFGVLMANLLTCFRVSHLEYALVFHTHGGLVNQAVDYLREIFISGKAMALFSMVFGGGLAVQIDRAKAGGRRPVWFLLRRLFVLFCFGILHWLLVWDGDVLLLYALCGCVALLFVKVPARWLWPASGLFVFGVEAILSTEWERAFDRTEWREFIDYVSESYAQGGYLELVELRWMMLPYELGSRLSYFFPTVGLMLLGMAAHRSGLLYHPERWRGLLIKLIIYCGLVGAFATPIQIYGDVADIYFGRFNLLWTLLAHIPVAVAYGSAMLLYLARYPDGTRRLYLAAAGRMALTNYLMQSLFFSVIFYGYGWGLFGIVPTAEAAVLGIVFYGWQLLASRTWFQRHQFGPMEWLWRVLTYGRQGMRKASEPGPSSHRC